MVRERTITAEQGEIPRNFKIAVMVNPGSSASNLGAILDAQKDPDFYGRVGLVVASSIDAQGLQIARDRGITALTLPYDKPESMTGQEYRKIYSSRAGQIMKAANVDLAVMVGFDRILTQEYFDEFGGPTTNTHPGAVPDEIDKPYFFEDGTEAPWNRRMQGTAAVANFLPLKYATSTIHIATVVADFGPILKRVFAEVIPGDTEDTLYERLKKAEHEGIIEVLKNPPITNRT